MEKAKWKNKLADKAKDIEVFRRTVENSCEGGELEATRLMSLIKRGEELHMDTRFLVFQLTQDEELSEQYVPELLSVLAEAMEALEETLDNMHDLFDQLCEESDEQMDMAILRVLYHTEDDEFWDEDEDEDEEPGEDEVSFTVPIPTKLNINGEKVDTSVWENENEVELIVPHGVEVSIVF